MFKPGDEVFYAGSIMRPGTNAEYHLVDERIVGKKPKTLSFAQAAALPLTSITAWEMLFDRFAVAPGKAPDGRALLVIGGAGGVGSILIQLASRLTALTVIATASRPQTRDWCLKLGAHHVIDHTKPIPAQLKANGHERVALIAGLTNTQDHLPAIIELIAPQGKFALIDDPKVLDINPFKGKSVSVHWESMFTRSSFKTPDMIAQHNLLNEVSRHGRRRPNRDDDGQGAVADQRGQLARGARPHRKRPQHRQGRGRRLVSYSFAGTVRI